MTAQIVLPHQLFDPQQYYRQAWPVFMLEEELFFTQYRFHLSKLAFHRSSMRAFEKLLVSLGFKVHYYDCKSACNGVQKLLEHLHKEGYTDFRIYDPCDDWIERRLRKAAQVLGVQLSLIKSPQFICSREELAEYRSGHRRYFQTEFYIWQRKRLGIMLEPDCSPQGGRWTFDTLNRLKLPKKALIPPPLPESTSPNYLPALASFREQAMPGTECQIRYPVTHQEASHWFENFLEQRLFAFGLYEDAMSPRSDTLFHSVLSPLINTGLLTPSQIINKTLEFIRHEKVEMNNTEGFIRQIIGWREYIRMIYLFEGRKQRTKNHLNHHLPMPPAFYKGQTGLQPFDELVKKINRHGYAHHIERLMIAGNLMLLCEIDPNDVYRWFMELFIDSFDWVMVPNVYGMSQFADGGLMCTKPYICGSNYLMKMGEFGRGPWQETWNALYWDFVASHHDLFLNNPRSQMMLNLYHKQSGEQKLKYQRLKEQFLERMYA